MKMMNECSVAVLWKLLIIFLFRQESNGIARSNIVTAVYICGWLEPGSAFFTSFETYSPKYF